MMQVGYFQKTCAWCGASIEYCNGYFGVGGLLNNNVSETEKGLSRIILSVTGNLKKAMLASQTLTLPLNGKRVMGGLLPSSHENRCLNIIFLGCTGECIFELKQALEEEKPIDVEMSLWVISSYGL